jgi:hypothetical protein
VISTFRVAESMGFNGDPAHCFLVLVALRRPLGCSVEGSGGAAAPLPIILPTTSKGKRTLAKISPGAMWDSPAPVINFRGLCTHGNARSRLQRLC